MIPLSQRGVTYECGECGALAQNGTHFHSRDRGNGCSRWGSPGVAGEWVYSAEELAVLSAPPLLDPGQHLPAGVPMAQAPETRKARRVDLGPYLRDELVLPEPVCGGWRDDGRQMLYPGRWHTAIAQNTAGKSWFALWHCLEEMRRGSHVAYAHFEESSPMGTIDRLRKLGAEDKWIEERFVWLDTETVWRAGEFAAVLAELPEVPVLLVLDGINAACSKHQWPVEKTEGVGAYRAAFVTPAAARGTAVLSLGHPPKARDRQNERHTYGSTAWLDEVDGVGFRLEASGKKPFSPGAVGYTSVYVVKDRYGSVQAGGLAIEKGDSTWHDVGSLQLDSETPGMARMRLLRPKERELSEGGGLEFTDSEILNLAVLRVLSGTAGAFDSFRALGTSLRAAGVKHTTADLQTAVAVLEGRGALEIVRSGRALGGRLLSPPPAAHSSETIDPQA